MVAANWNSIAGTICAALWKDDRIANIFHDGPLLRLEKITIH
jgi:hypothetical protein